MSADPNTIEEAGEEEEKLAEGTLISHLVELRQRLVHATLAVSIVFLCLLPFTRKVYQFVSSPMLDSLPEEWTMIATDPTAPFLVPFKTTLFAAIVIAMPVVLYQAWQFVAPGLYRKEKRFALPLVVSSIVLFYCGMAFAYYVVFPLFFAFTVAITPEGVEHLPDINAYLNFVMKIFFAFGLAFEVPIATFMLIWTRLTTLETLAKARPYIFLGAFIIGMFLTPPDFISQTLLAVPMYLLYEGGLIMSRVMLADRIKADREEAEREAAADEADEAESEDDKN